MPHVPSVRIAQHSASQPSLDVEQQDQLFQKTIARLREENNPLSVARSTAAPQGPRTDRFNIVARVTAHRQFQGILVPVGAPWHLDGYTYYYVRYYVEYADGSTESGIVPWPLRYAPKEDPFALGIEHIPLPAPLPDYSPPPGTVMHPLVAYCFAHRYDSPVCGQPHP